MDLFGDVDSQNAGLNRNRSDIFRDQLKAGNLTDALRTVVALGYQDASGLMLQCGFSVSGSASSKGQKEFWSRCQSEVARACRHRVDGWGLRDLDSIKQNEEVIENGTDEQRDIRGAIGDGNRGDGTIDGADSRSMGERLASTGQEADQRSEAYPGLGGANEQGAGDSGSIQGSETPGSSREDGILRDRSTTADVNSNVQWITSKEAETLSEAYSAHLQGKPGEPKPVKIATFNGRPVTVFSVWYLGQQGIGQITVGELTPLEEHQGDTYTTEQLHAMWKMDLQPNRTHVGLVVQARGRKYVVANERMYRNRENYPAQDQEEREAHAAEPLPDDFSVEETQIGLAVDSEDAVNLREYLAEDIDPATGKPIHSEGRRLQLQTELENLQSGIDQAKEALEVGQAGSGLAATDEEAGKADYGIGDRVVLRQATNKELIGRHGEIVESRPMNVRTVQLYSNEPSTFQRYVSYVVQTDEGTKLTTDHDFLELEMERPRVVIPDPLIDGEYMPPGALFNKIDYLQGQVRKVEASAARARKESNRAALSRQADAIQANAELHRRVWEEWSWLNPEAAMAIEEPNSKAAQRPAKEHATTLPDGVRIANFQHTQTGETKFAVNLVKRVDRQDFLRIKNMASKYGGHWSSFSRGGAIPGFLFDSEEAAHKWIEEIASTVGLVMEAPVQPSLDNSGSAAEVIESADEQQREQFPVAIIPITAGAYKGWYQAKATDGQYAGTVGDADRTEEGARQALASKLEEIGREGIGPDLGADGTSQAVEQQAEEIPELPAYALGREEAEELRSYFQQRYADDAFRFEAFSRMISRAEDGLVEEKGADDPYKDPVKWAVEWLETAREDRGSAQIVKTSENVLIEMPAPAVIGHDISHEVEQPEEAIAPQRQSKPRERPVSTGASDKPTDFTIRDEDEIGKGGQKSKYRDNIEAIRIIKQLDENGTRASSEEQKALVRYVGWGGLKGVFNPDNQEWSAERAELVSLLSNEEYASARRSQLDAHYTPFVAIDAIYSGLQQIGFNGGRMLESSIGTGHFVGRMPLEMRANSRVIGIELDSITGKIAQHLYPNSEITVGKGFQEISMPAGFFDVAVGNPPFGNQSVFDSDHPELRKFSLHNFFFAKSLDKVREGGVLSMVVSRYFMDAQDSSTRQWIAERAKLLGAYRLPNTAFKENAGTEVVTDIIFLQKLKEGELSDQSWVASIERNIEGMPAADEANAIFTNQYFQDNPSHILGKEAVESNQYTAAGYTVNEAGEWQSRLINLVRETLPSGIYQAGPSKEAMAKLVDVDVLIPEYTKVGAYFTGEDGKVRQRLSDQFDKQRSIPVEFKTESAEQRARGMIGVRNALRELMRRELSEDSYDVELMRLRVALNRTYDDFVKKHGFINSLGNRRAFAEDPDLPLLESLEPDYDPGLSREVAEKQGVEPRKPKAGKADIFRHRVLVPYSVTTRVENAKDGLIASLNHQGRVDIEYIGKLYGKDSANTISELRGLIYKDPDKGWVTADEYLSGNVKHKLARAKEAASMDPVYSENINALEAVQPADIEPIDIRARLGTPWIPTWVVEQFANELWAPSSLNVHYIAAVAQWSFKSTGGDPAALNSRWGTSDVPADRIVDALLNNRTIVVRKNIGTSREPHWIVLEKETEAARAKAEEVGQKFKDWIWQDHERCEKLARIYNDTMNTNRQRTYDGSHLTLPGTNPVIELRPSQKAAIWRGVAERVVLLDHRVGAGKTFTKIGIAMEQRRLGILKKPMFCVPNHLVRQWRDSFYELYPGANVLAATEADFEKDNRHKLFAKITTGDWDAVIIGHSSLKKIGLPLYTEHQVLKEMIDDISFAIEMAKVERGDRNITRDMERIKQNLEAKMKTLSEKAGLKDNVVTFDELGVDGLFVDELDEFKNLFFTTTMTQVAGLGNASGSGKAFDLFVKRRWLVEKYGEQAVFVGGTGTPISNSLVEMFTMQRYMIYDEMRRRGIHNLDAWAGCFGDVQHVYEVHPSGSGYRMSTRFAKFVNMPELMALYKGFADVVTLDDLKAQAEAQGRKFPIPRLAGGKPTNMVAERSDLQQTFFGVAVFEREGEGGIQFAENRHPNEVKFAEAADGKWTCVDTMRDDVKIGKFDTKEGAVADYVADYLTPKTGFNEGSILWLYENLPELMRKTNGKVNALSITNQARKAGLDYRLIDPAAPDYSGSKINLAADEIYRIYKKWDKDRGTQLVFCDLSVPLSERERIGSSERKAFIRDDAGDLAQVKATTHPIPDSDGYVFYAVKQGRMYQAYDSITGNRLPMPATMKRSDLVDSVLAKAKAGLDWYNTARGETPPIDDDAIDAWRAENEKGEEGAEVDSADQISMTDLLAVAGKSRFSVYDDLRAKLIERGIPPEEIAFIHDYDTAKKKAELFKDINEGRKRVTFGSTPKMGAGTNVQERLVGLHHLDCPWRPRDLEQRDGRIERQGNKLYERDPEGFEVEILRYATRQTYDTRMWQIVEHKARGVQQLRKAGMNEREIDDLGGEAASAADMKAAASGNPLILEEIRLRNEVKSLDAQREGWLRSRHDLNRRLSWLKQTFEHERRTREFIEPMIKHRDSHSNGNFRIKIAGRLFDDRQMAGEGLKKAMVECLKSRPGDTVDIDDYRGFRFELSRETSGVRVGFGVPGGKAEFHVAFYDAERDKFSASGFFQRMDNRLAEFEATIAGVVNERKQAEHDIPLIEAELQVPFGKDAELDEKRSAHREVISQLKKAGGTVQLSNEMKMELGPIVHERAVFLNSCGFAVDQEMVNSLLKPNEDEKQSDLKRNIVHVEESLKQSFSLAKGMNMEIEVNPKETRGMPYAGKVIAVYDHHVVQDVGRSLVVHQKGDFHSIPSVGAYVRLSYDAATGRVVDIGQSEPTRALIH
jgi:N12 class adenine-specific DNA methylase/predicted RNA methylase